MALRAWLFLTAVLPLAGGATLDDCRALRHHGKTTEATTCYTALNASGDPYLRAEGLWGLGDYNGANDQFRKAAKDSKSAHVRVRWGRLFLERFNREEATSLFQEALQ